MHAAIGDGRGQGEAETPHGKPAGLGCSLTGEGESGRFDPPRGVTTPALRYPRAGPCQLKPALGGNYKKSGTA